MCGERGRGVVATTFFEKGEILLNYHGRKITPNEGREMLMTLDANDRRSDYVFFGPWGLCVDGSAERCPCHPNVRTMGRLLNWANKGTPECNIRARYFASERRNEQALEAILFVASRNISPLEELRFDYGDKDCKDIFGN